MEENIQRGVIFGLGLIFEGPLDCGPYFTIPHIVFKIFYLRKK